MSFLTTKFARFMIGIRKNKNMTQDTYSFVPLLNFDRAYTDDELYSIFGLEVNEIEYIEKMITKK